MITCEPCNPEQIKVTLLKGGKSNEREISLQSGAACAQALREQGFSVVELDTADEGFVEQLMASTPDVVFLALHGRDGEDGCVQGLCEILGYPYTGPGVLASALAMDKLRCKAFYRAAGLPTAPWAGVQHGKIPPADELLEQVGIPCVVKPSHEGSALGVHIVNTSEELMQALEDALALDDEVVVERFVGGTEVTVAVLGNDDPEALPVIEIVPQEASDFYDFEAKYAQGGSTHIIPARLPEELNLECQRIALDAHRALGCTGVSRSDIIVEDGGSCWLLETNTLPGMTSTSLLPDAARKVGIEFGPLCRLLVELALEGARS